VLDFYYAATPLPTVADLLFGKGSDAADAYYERWRTTLIEEPKGVAALLRSLIYHRNRTALSSRITQAVKTELNYFRTHAAQMRYADFRAAHLPIGSGVMEAGCKELIKARFCRSGRRWNRPTAAPLSQLRAIRLSQYWDRFWSKVVRYAAYIRTSGRKLTRYTPPPQSPKAVAEAVRYAPGGHPAASALSSAHPFVQ
jgi:hypothetical protein